MTKSSRALLEKIKRNKEMQIETQRGKSFYYQTDEDQKVQ